MTQKDKLTDITTSFNHDTPKISRLRNSHIILGRKERQSYETKDDEQKNRTGTYRMVVAMGIGIILLVIATGILAVLTPGIPLTGTENITSKGLANPVDQGENMLVKTNTPGISTDQLSPVKISQDVAGVPSLPLYQDTASVPPPPWAQDTATVPSPPWAQQDTASVPPPPWAQDTATVPSPPWAQDTVNTTSSP